MINAKIFNELFGVELSNWEALIAAGCCLAGKQIQLEAFHQIVGSRLQTALSRIEVLPEYWAREICLEVLHAQAN